MPYQKVENCSAVPPNLTIKVLGQENSVYSFKIKQDLPMKNLMTIYCKKIGIDMNIVRFRFDGQVITKDDTPVSLKLADGETIEVYQRMTGGALGTI